jgi:hypothetical protein
MKGREQQREHRYTSARDRAEKQSSGFTGSYLKLPDGVQLFKPKQGIILIDILPFEAGEGNPWAEAGCLHWERTYHAHRGIGANSEMFLCPRSSAKQPCPVCEYRHKLQSAGNEDDEQMVKDLAPKQRQIFNIINLKDPDKGVQLWDMSYHCFGKVLDARLRNSDDSDGWDQFFFLEGGFSLKVGFAEKSFGGFTFLEAESIDFKPRSKDYDDSILDEVHCLDDLLIVPEYDALKKAFLEVEKTPADEPPKRTSRGASRAEPTPTEERGSRRTRDPEAHPDPDPAGTERTERRSRQEEPPADMDDFDKRGRRGKPAEDPEPEPERPARGSRRADPDPDPEPEPKRTGRQNRADPEPEPEPEPSRGSRRTRDPEPEEDPPRRSRRAEPEEDTPHVRQHPKEDAPAGKQGKPGKSAKDDWD